MEIQGKVIAVLPIKDGVGKTSGNEWKSREFVLETEESRPQSLCLQLMNANIDRYAVEAGQTVHVKFDCSARQWENRWFNTLTAWEVTVIVLRSATSFWRISSVRLLSALTTLLSGGIGVFACHSPLTARYKSSWILGNVMQLPPFSCRNLSIDLIRQGVNCLHILGVTTMLKLSLNWRW